jgi:hypothetical protein
LKEAIEEGVAAPTLPDFDAEAAAALGNALGANDPSAPALAALDISFLDDHAAAELFAAELFATPPLLALLKSASNSSNGANRPA